MSSTSLMKLLKCLMLLVAFPLDFSCAHREVLKSPAKSQFSIHKHDRSCNSYQMSFLKPTGAINSCIIISQCNMVKVYKPLVTSEIVRVGSFHMIKIKPKLTNQYVWHSIEI